jgi:hypothetical protein
MKCFCVDTLWRAEAMRLRQRAALGASAEKARAHIDAQALLCDAVCVLVVFCENGAKCRPSCSGYHTEDAGQARICLSAQRWPLLQPNWRSLSSHPASRAERCAPTVVRAASMTLSRRSVARLAVTRRPRTAERNEHSQW